MLRRPETLNSQHMSLFRLAPWVSGKVLWLQNGFTGQGNTKLNFKPGEKCVKKKKYKFSIGSLTKVPVLHRYSLSRTSLEEKGNNTDCKASFYCHHLSFKLTGYLPP